MPRVIHVTTGKGVGDTEMAAFDAALFDAHVANYNLVRLSSIIPPDSDIVRAKPQIRPEEFGDKLFVVYASQIQTEVGKEAWAGIGWVIAEDGSKKGLFTEHEGSSEEEVKKLIHDTLNCMVRYRPEKYSPVQFELSGITCTEKPVCALVVATYESESWK